MDTHWDRARCEIVKARRACRYERQVDIPDARHEIQQLDAREKRGLTRERDAIGGVRRADPRVELLEGRGEPLEIGRRPQGTNIRIDGEQWRTVKHGRQSADEDVLHPWRSRQINKLHQLYLVSSPEAEGNGRVAKRSRLGGAELVL